MTPTFYADLERLTDVAMGYRAAKPLLVALHYELFSRVEEGLDTSAALARRLRLHGPALERLLDALCALGWLSKRAGRYANTRAGRRLLVASSPDYMGDNLKYQEYTWDAWSELRDVLRTGRPRVGLRGWIRKRFFTADYIKAMGDITRHPARELAGKLELDGVRTMLDVGSGAGTFSAACVAASPTLRATLLDLPEPLEVARGLLSAHPQRARLRFRPANYLLDELGDASYDLVLISNVTRVEDEATNRALVAKAFRALKPGGRLVIHDFTISGCRTRPRFSALLNLHVLVFTGKGTVYTPAQYRSWMRAAGFARVSALPIARRSPFPSLATVGWKA